MESNGDMSMNDEDVIYVDDAAEVIEIDETTTVGELTERFNEVVERIKDEDRIDEDCDEIEELTEDGELVEPILTFSEHNGETLCVAVSRSSGLAATGGTDDIAYVWNTSTGKVHFKCTGHKESITYVGFSHELQYVATLDLAGVVQVFKTSDGSCVFEFDTGGTDHCDSTEQEEFPSENWVAWHHSSNILFCATALDGIYVWLIPQGITKVIPCYDSPVSTASCLPDGKRLLVGYKDGKCRVVDIKAVKAQLVEQTEHQDEVLAASCHCDNVMGMTGSADGVVQLININTHKKVYSMDLKEFCTADQQTAVEAIAFCSNSPSLAVIADTHGLILVFDITKQVVRLKLQQPAGTSRLVPIPGTLLVCAAGLDGVVRVWDVHNGKLMRRLVGHEDEVLALAVDERTVVSGSKDGTVNVYELADDEC